MGEARAGILIVADDASVASALAEASIGDGIRVEAAGTGEAAIERASRGDLKAVVVDADLASMDGLDLLSRLREAAPKLPIVLVGSHLDVAVEAMKRGAADFLGKPLDGPRLGAALRGLLAAEETASQTRVRRETQEAKALRERFPEIIARSPKMLDVFRMVERIAPTGSTAVIYGETGTGKELVARAIHRVSKRSKGPFVATSGAIPEGLMESELFGYVKGAFTGAYGNKEGLFEASNGGTLFLDEIGDISPQMQVELLRVVQEGEIQRVGDTRVRKVDVRLLAATNRDLAVEIKRGRFREDLFYRLNVVSLTLPPLRERTGDIPLLVEFFVGDKRERSGSRVEGLTPEALACLERYRWPGNIRELEHVIERALVLADGPLLAPGDLPAEMRGAT